MASKFDLIIESALNRYQGINFLIGDRVKMIDNYTKHEWWGAQPALKLERLKGLIESGDNIRVSAVKAIRPSTAQSGHFQDVDGYYVDIVREAAPGLMYSNEVYTLPDYLIELQEDYPNLAGETPDSQKRADTSNIKPEDVNIEDDEGLFPRDKQTRGDGHDNKENPTDNTNIETAPAGKSYTTKYMEN